LTVVVAGTVLGDADPKDVKPEDVAKQVCRTCAGSVEERVAAIDALSKMPQEYGALAAMVDRLYDGDPVVQVRAASALGSVGTTAELPHLVARLRSMATADTGAPASSKETAIERTPAYVEIQIQQAMIAILRRAEAKDAERGLEELAAVIGESREPFRVRLVVAATTATVSKTPLAVPVLVEGLAKDPSPHIRAHCARILGTLADRSAIPALTAALQDAYVTPEKHIAIVRDAAAWALKQLGE
jgi:HEAT repeat protein